MHDIHNAYIHVQVMLYIMSYIMYGPMKSTHVIVGGDSIVNASRQRHMSSDLIATVTGDLNAIANGTLYFYYPFA